MDALLAVLFVVAATYALLKGLSRFRVKSIYLGPRWELHRLLAKQRPLIEAAEQELARWESSTGGPLTKLESVWLHERAIRIGSEVIPLVNVRAEAVSYGDVSVESRPTLTRAALGGCLFGWWGALFSIFIPKRETHDARKPMLRLWVEGRERILSFKPYHDHVVFELAAMINNQALEAPDLMAHQEQFIRESKMELLKARADTPEIAALRARVNAGKRGKMDPSNLGGDSGPRITDS